MTPRWDDESDEEADALRLWAGVGAVPLLRHDRKRRALLLGRARPGDDLGTLDEDEATSLRSTSVASSGSPPGRPSAGSEIMSLAGSSGRRKGRGADCFRRRDGCSSDLDIGATTLVHGDFHHHNLLSSDGRWVAIDPKPMLGEPEYDVAPFLWNPIPYRMRRDVTQRRLAAFAAAGLDEARIRAWAVIRASYLGADDDGVEVLRALA